MPEAGRFMRTCWNSPKTRAGGSITGSEEELTDDVTAAAAAPGIPVSPRKNSRPHMLERRTLRPTLLAWTFLRNQCTDAGFKSFA
eukprot:scaffold182225_cov31-Tisochrysis_lutea.AAC.3